MDKREYREFKANVADFFAREGIENLSSCGGSVCVECGGTVCGGCRRCKECGDKTPKGGHEPFFSSRPCDCCARPLAGNREYAAGYNSEVKAVYVYRVCTDCIYFAEYGQLDDTTMLGIEEGVTQ